MNKNKATISALLLVVLAMTFGLFAGPLAAVASADVGIPQMDSEDINDKFKEFEGGDVQGLCDDLKTDIDRKDAQLDQLEADLTTATSWQTKSLLRIKIRSLSKNIHYLKAIYITECVAGAY